MSNLVKNICLSHILVLYKCINWLRTDCQVLNACLCLAHRPPVSHFIDSQLGNPSWYQFGNLVPPGGGEFHNNENIFSKL